MTGGICGIDVMPPADLTNASNHERNYTMKYPHLKTKLIALFDQQKLDGTLNDNGAF